MKNEQQQHLSHKGQIDLGSFYTPKHLVSIAFDMVAKHIENIEQLTLLDSSCGYGSFLGASGFKRIVGADIDEKAIDNARENVKNADFYITNSLKDIKKSNYDIADEDKILTIGNPPYNDTTSIIRQDIKDKTAVNEIDRDVRTRDLGMSFLLSYDKLGANYICVLHPLSYLIKKANFALLKNFTKNYQLGDALIVSSHEFSDTSRSMAFPIVIAFYRRGEAGMDYNFIRNYRFKVKDDGEFCLSDYDTIANYVQKYPNRNQLMNIRNEPVAKFWTLRDINALRRNRTFIENDTYNTIYVFEDGLPYYCYIDIFKQYVDKVPYYLGNCDIIIDNEKFVKIRDCFTSFSIKTNPILKKSLNCREVPNAKEQIDQYFKELLN